MHINLKPVKFGLLLVLLTLVFGIMLGIYFGIAEDAVKSYISEGVAAHPAVHDDKSTAKIWRYAQRAHFHATGIAAFSLGLILLTLFTYLKPKMKTAAAALIGLAGFYPLSWFSMFVLAPSIGRSAAHHHWLTETLTYIGVGGLLLGIAIVFSNLFLGFFEDKLNQ